VIEIHGACSMRNSLWRRWETSRIRQKLSQIRNPDLLFKWFMQLDFRTAVWLAPLVWSLHEAEEGISRIDIFTRKHFIDSGSLATISPRGLWMALGVVAFNGVIWTAVTALPHNPRFAAFLTLPFFVYFSFANVLQHIYWSAYFRTYARGVITAVLLVAPVVIGLTAKAIEARLIPWWYATALYATVVPTLVSTVLASNLKAVLPWPIKV
jgi:uncharacterized protein with HXXEE motif